MRVATAGELRLTVSPSSLATFTWCGLKFYFTYVAGWRTPANEPAWVVCTHCGVPLRRPDGGPVALPDGGRLGPDPRDLDDEA